MCLENHENSYVVHTALREEQNEGWFWVKDPMLEDKLQNYRRIVCINQKVYCEALYADKYYLEEFEKRRKSKSRPDLKGDDPLIFLNGWQRQSLGISSKDICKTKQLKITFSNSPALSLWWQFKSCLQHPQIVVFLATMLAVISLGLGLIGVGLGFIGIKTLCPVGENIGIAFIALGGIICVFSIVSFYKRAAT